MWHDVTLLKQTLFRKEGEKLVVIQQDGKEQRMNGCLVNRYPFGSELLTPGEIQTRLSTTEREKQDCKEFTAFIPDKELVAPTEKIRLRFELNQEKKIGQQSEKSVEHYCESMFFSDSNK